MTTTPPTESRTGIWVAATAAHGRDITTDQPYPHICGMPVPSVRPGRPVYFGRRDCAACDTTGGTA
jgi:hypothetical protein